MEILRASLDVLFNEMDPTFFLKKDAEAVVSWLGTEGKEEEKLFIKNLQKRCDYLTYDQCSIAAKLFAKGYCSPLETIRGLKFAPSPSIFNAILRFSGEVLSMDDSVLLCVFKHLLRWSNLTSRIGEDLLTTSYLASHDIVANYTRTSFDWGLVLGHNDQKVNEVFENEMADVHMHLKGSSSNFDLNWLSLMVFPESRRKEYEDLYSTDYVSVLPSKVNDAVNEETCLAVKASVIRFLLFIKYVKHSNLEIENELKEIIYSKNKETDKWAARIFSLILDELLVVLSKDQFLVHDHEKVDALPPYDRLAILIKHQFLGHDYIDPIRESEIKTNPNLLVGGERHLLYSCFQSCYNGLMPPEDLNIFYVYLLIKNHTRNLLIQNNNIAGFRNFDSYDKQKTRFVKDHSAYEPLVEPLALGQYFYMGKSRYVEPRITPKNASGEITDMLIKLENQIHRYSCAKPKDYNYVFHFIKKIDDVVLHAAPINARHHSLRETVKNQAIAIEGFRRVSDLKERVVGIDAANSEVYARPEVFAQAFRFLRRKIVSKTEENNSNRLGFTYHVGEDFLSPVDGLRAIDEVLKFMNFGEGDRIGHALVLGIDSVRYYRRCHHTLLLPQQMVIDNIAWCLNKQGGKTLFTDQLKQELEELFGQVYENVYGSAGVPTLHDYFESWLLRGDNPDRYAFLNTQGLDKGPRISGWPDFDFNAIDVVEKARNNKKSLDLYYRYHYDKQVRELGQKVIEVRVPKGMSNMICSLQRDLIDEISHKGISIEANPTSNYRIGNFERYLDLPIITIPKNIGTDISFSVNTDDRGVFATALEREFSLLACALSKGDPDNADDGLTMPAIVAKLEEWRKAALTQKFIRRV